MGGVKVTPSINTFSHYYYPRAKRRPSIEIQLPSEIQPPSENQALVDNAVNLQTLFPHVDYNRILKLLTDHNNNIDTVASIVIG